RGFAIIRDQKKRPLSADPVPLRKADGTPRETTKIVFEGLSRLKVLQGKMAALDPDADYFLSPLCTSAQ
ncbi:MAG: hypothetical protein ACPF9G_11620, partial [Paracoccaceae bacterium]